MFYQIKNINNSVKDVDSTSRRVKVAISQVGSKDFDNDVIDPGAYTKTISERGPKAANLIWHLTDHTPSLKTAIGKFSELYMEKDYLVGVTDIPNTSWGNDMLEFYKSGHINQHSIGFKTILDSKAKDSDYNLIKEILLYEGSAVLWGANPNTPTISAGKSINKEEEAKKLTTEMDMLIKSFKNGSYTDNAFELIETRMRQIQQTISELFKDSTEAAKEIRCPKCGKNTKDEESGMGYIKCVHCKQTFSSQAPEPQNELAKLKEAIQLITFTNIYNGNQRH